MKLKRTRKSKPVIPTNSMSDIAFLLLIFIMLISLINYRKEVKISYPEANYQEVTQADDNLEIWVDESGVIFHKGQVVDYAQIEGIIVDAVVRNPKVRIHLIADKNTEYENVNGVIDVLKLLNHRVVSLVVKEHSS